MQKKRTEPTVAVGLSNFDTAAFLTDEATIAAYVSTVTGEGDPTELERALVTVARARRMNAARQSKTQGSQDG